MSVSTMQAVVGKIVNFIVETVAKERIVFPNDEENQLLHRSLKKSLMQFTILCIWPCVVAFANWYCTFFLYTNKIYRNARAMVLLICNTYNRSLYFLCLCNTSVQTGSQRAKSSQNHRRRRLNFILFN